MRLEPKKLTTKHFEALAEYWAAITTDEEMAAHAKMIALGLPDHYTLSAQEFNSFVQEFKSFVRIVRKSSFMAGIQSMNTQSVAEADLALKAEDFEPGGLLAITDEKETSR